MVSLRTLPRNHFQLWTETPHPSNHTAFRIQHITGEQEVLSPSRDHLAFWVEKSQAKSEPSTPRNKGISQSSFSNLASVSSDGEYASQTAKCFLCTYIAWMDVWIVWTDGSIHHVYLNAWADVGTKVCAHFAFKSFYVWTAFKHGFSPWKNMKKHVHTELAYVYTNVCTRHTVPLQHIRCQTRTYFKKTFKKNN